MQNRMYSHLIFSTSVLLILIISGRSPAASQSPQKTYSLDGIVVDAHERTPVVSATVEVAGTQTKARSGVDGRFVLRNLAPGRYTLRISSTGYHTVTVDSLVVPSGHDPLVILFTPADVCDGIEERAKNDLAHGIVTLWSGGGLKAAKIENAATVDSINAKYGFHYAETGCIDFCSDRYNAVVQVYLDFRNGAGWADRLRKEIDALHDTSRKK